MSVIINRQDLEFILYDVLNVEAVCSRDAFKDHSRDVFDHVMEAAEKLAINEFYPIAKETDVEEPQFKNGTAVLPQSTHKALNKLKEGGFFGAGFSSEFGGLQYLMLSHKGLRHI